MNNFQDLVLVGQQLKDRTQHNRSFIRFSKEHIPKWENNGSDAIVEKRILFILPYNSNLNNFQLAIMFLIVSDIYYHNYTGIRFVLHDDVIQRVDDSSFNNLESTHNGLLNLHPANNIIYIYLAEGTTYLGERHELNATTITTSPIVISNQFHVNPVLLAHEIGHVLGMDHESNINHFMHRNTLSFINFKIFQYQVFNLHEATYPNNSSLSSVSREGRSINIISGGTNPHSFPDDNGMNNLTCETSLFFLEASRIDGENSHEFYLDNIPQAVVDSVSFELLSNHIDLDECIEQVIDCEFLALESYLDSRSDAYKSHLEEQFDKISSVTIVDKKFINTHNKINLFSIEGSIRKNYKKTRTQHLKKLLEARENIFTKLKKDGVLKTPLQAKGSKRY